MRAWSLVPILFAMACSSSTPPQETRVTPTPQVLTQHCRDSIGEPRVIEVTPNLFVAVGYDLANTIVLKTPHGNVVIDAMMSPERAREAKAELAKKAPGPTKALIYTHSHVDHIGGASVWLDEGTEIWATERFRDHFIKQYGVFQHAERVRGIRQFARHIPEESLACSALGRRPDFTKTVGGGIRLPTKTFSGKTSFEVGGVTVELVEAHGETDDQLFVWIPSEKALMPGDNYYQAFPNLYTIRGTRPRPVDAWISSLDSMRVRQPEHLLPSHTIPVSGAQNVQQRLTDYRDAIAWVRNHVVQSANGGKRLSEIRETAALPEHLASKPYLLELYGQLDWSAEAIYSNELGWFDGHAEHLYTPKKSAATAKEIELMGGRPKVLSEAERALKSGEPRWAVHLLDKLLLTAPSDDERSAVQSKLSEAHRAVAKGVYNTNGRGYLLQTAFEYTSPKRERFKPQINEQLLAEIPIRSFFDIMQTRLKTHEAMNVHETLEVAFTDLATSYFVTVRRGVVEVSEGKALPGTPKPVATLRTTTMTWKHLALGKENPVSAIASDKLEIDGSALAVRAFTERFQKGF